MQGEAFARPKRRPDMSKPLFREKNLKKVNSPESLNDYVRVSNPGVWLLLAAVIALLAGALDQRAAIVNPNDSGCCGAS